MSTAAKDPRVNDLFTEGSHHRNLSVIAINQNKKDTKDKKKWRFRFKVGDSVRITHLRNVFTREMKSGLVKFLQFRIDFGDKVFLYTG